MVKGLAVRYVIRREWRRVDGETARNYSGNGVGEIKRYLRKSGVCGISKIFGAENRNGDRSISATVSKL